MIKIVHMADLHLDHLDHSGMPTLKAALEENRYQTFLRAMDFAVEKSADLFILAGDLFDGDKITLKSVMFLNDGMKYLLDNGIRPVICYGNHDPLTFYDKWDIQLPDDCIVFGADPERILLTSRDKEKYALTGCSHESEKIFENRGSLYPHAAPKMANIGILHGQVENWADDEEPYMPCKISDLEEKGYSLWCLGHIHKRKELRQINGFYPGSLIGNNFKEVGAKGIYYHELIKGQLNYEFIPLSDLIFESMTIDTDSAEGIHSIDELVLAMVKQAEVVRKRTEIDSGMHNIRMIFKVTVQGRSALYYKLQDSESKKFLEEALEDREWIEKVQVDLTELMPDVDLSNVSQNGSFPGYCMELIKDPNFLKTVLDTIGTESLAAKELFESVEQEQSYRDALMNGIEKDVLKHLFKNSQS